MRIRIPCAYAGGRRVARSGQAIIEFCVAMVAFVVLIAALLQIGRLSSENIDTLNRATTEANMYAMSDNYATAGAPPDFILDWDPGDDGATYSRDDEITPADPAMLWEDIVIHARPDDLRRQLPTNQLSRLNRNYELTDDFQFVHGHDTSDDIELFPVVRHLLYQADSVELEGHVWMVWTRQIP